MEDEDEVMAEDSDDGFSPETLKIGNKKVSPAPMQLFSMGRHHGSVPASAPEWLIWQKTVNEIDVEKDRCISFNQMWNPS